MRWQLVSSGMHALRQAPTSGLAPPPQAGPGCKHRLQKEGAATQLSMERAGSAGASATTECSGRCTRASAQLRAAVVAAVYQRLGGHSLPHLLQLHLLHLLGFSICCVCSVSTICYACRCALVQAPALVLSPNAGDPGRVTFRAQGNELHLPRRQAPCLRWQLWCGQDIPPAPHLGLVQTVPAAAPEACRCFRCQCRTREQCSCAGGSCSSAWQCCH